MLNSFKGAAGSSYPPVPKEFFEVYPLLKQAFEEQREYLHLMRCEVYERFQPRAISIIEDTVDATHEVKQALMIAAVLCCRSDRDFTGEEVTKKYGPIAGKIMNDINGPPSEHMTRNIVRLNCIAQICKMEELRNATLQNNPRVAAVIYVAVSQQDSEPPIEDPSGLDPRLERLHRQTVKLLRQSPGLGPDSPPPLLGPYQGS